MALVVKMPASELPVKPKDIDLDFFNKNIFDTSKEDEITLLATINSAKELKTLAQDFGMSKEEVKKVL